MRQHKMLWVFIGIDMFIKQLQRNVFDVFMGNGFMNWTRIKRTHYGVSVVAGNRLPYAAIREITARINN